MTQNQWHGCDWKRADKINWIGSKVAVLTVLFLYPVFDFTLLTLSLTWKENRGVKSAVLLFPGQ